MQLFPKNLEWQRLAPQGPPGAGHHHQIFPSLQIHSRISPRHLSKDPKAPPRFAEIFAIDLLPPIEQLLTVRQVAQLLGVCRATVYKWAAKGLLAHVRHRECDPNFATRLRLLCQSER